ncbi:MAG: phenylacetate--CoA ligase family protein, partial [Chitinophagaceae bacterium]|nr:phenylacetate--CoA ligase family protein [Rubrivivax sp.]
MTDMPLYDSLEARSAADRAAALCRALPAQVAAAQRTPAMAELLAGVDP